jgi:hypothetical protein
MAKNSLFSRTFVKIAIKFAFHKSKGFLDEPNNYKLFKDYPVFDEYFHVHTVRDCDLSC